MHKQSGSQSSQAHHNAASTKTVSVALVTVSDSRTEETDTNGKYLKQCIEAQGDVVSGYRIVKDDPSEITAVLEEFSSLSDVILFNGGTGISKRDTTFDVIQNKLEKILPGFGELFRLISFKTVGASAMFSRAVAGVYKNCVIISVPGSPDAVRTAWEQLISKELKHLAWELTR